MKVVWLFSNGIMLKINALDKTKCKEISPQIYILVIIRNSDQKIIRYKLGGFGMIGIIMVPVTIFSIYCTCMMV